MREYTNRGVRVSRSKEARRLRANPPPTLAPVRPNVGTQAKYRRQLQSLIREMHESVLYWVRAAYRANEPVIAQDELPANVLQRAMTRLSRRWQKKFNELGPKLGEYFAQSANTRSATQLQSMLKEHGFAVSFTMTRAARDVMNATIAEQVGLIKSIPQKYFLEVQGDVMRSIQAGHDMSQLTKALQENYGVTYRRAAFIARDQNSKAIASMTRVRQQEIGVTEAIWVHSGGGREPRPTHLAAGKRQQRYDVREGWYDPSVGKKIFPGELINCRCVSRAVIPGFV